MAGSGSSLLFYLSAFRQRFALWFIFLAFFSCIFDILMV